MNLLVSLDMNEQKVKEYWAESPWVRDEENRSNPSQAVVYPDFGTSKLLDDCNRQNLIKPIPSVNRDAEGNQNSNSIVIKESELDNGSSMQAPSPQSYFVMSFLVTLFFNLPLGALALFFSYKALKAFENEECKRGRFHAKVAFSLAMLGIVVSATTAMLVVFYIAYYDTNTEEENL